MKMWLGCCPAGIVGSRDRDRGLVEARCGQAVVHLGCEPVND